MDLTAAYFRALDTEMRRLLITREDGPPLLYGMLRYHLGWLNRSFEPAQVDGGKHIRPLILLLAVQAQGEQWEQAVGAAAAIELLHNFTLIHDDIEDRDVIRRGRETVWSLWGVAQALNAGDALFALSYRGLIELVAHGIPADRVVRATSRFTETVVYITEGQCRDLEFETRPATNEPEYLEMVRGKTAALLGLSAELGGIIAGTSQDRCDALREFGEALGIAFQMYDDILGLWGDPAKTGKPVGSDLLKGKKSMPILYGLRVSESLQHLLTASESSERRVAEALSELERVGSRDYTEERAAHYHGQALDALERTGGIGPAQEALRGLAERLLGREK